MKINYYKVNKNDQDVICRYICICVFLTIRLSVVYDTEMNHYRKIIPAVFTILHRFYSDVHVWIYFSGGHKWNSRRESQNFKGIKWHNIMETRIIEHKAWCWCPYKKRDLNEKHNLRVFFWRVNRQFMSEAQRELWGGKEILTGISGRSLSAKEYEDGSKILPQPSWISSATKIFYDGSHLWWGLCMWFSGKESTHNQET